MNTFTIAIIQPNKIKYEKKFLQKCCKEQLMDDIKKHIELIEVTNSTFMEIIVDKIKMTSKLIGSTELCYEDHESVYQLCHLSGEQNHTNDDENDINGLASYLTVKMVAVM